MTLLYNEPPIAVSPTLAKELGLNAAVFLQQLHYWVEQKKQHGSRYQDSFKDGYFWVYNTINEWLEKLPFLGSKSTFKRMIYDLQEKGILVIGNYNKFENDHTSWYRINYLRLEQISKSLQVQNEPPGGSKRDAGEFKMNLRAVQNEPSITRDYTETTQREDLNTPYIPPRGEVCEVKKVLCDRCSRFKPNTQDLEGKNYCLTCLPHEFKERRIITEIAMSTTPQKQIQQPTPQLSAPPPLRLTGTLAGVTEAEIAEVVDRHVETVTANPPGFDEFWQNYPTKVAKPAALKAWKKLKPSQALQDTILRDLAIRTANDRRWIEGFIPNPSTYLNQARWEDEIQSTKQRSKPMSKIEKSLAILEAY